jgi:hypothetical protein
MRFMAKKDTITIHGYVYELASYEWPSKYSDGSIKATLRLTKKENK